MASVFESSTCVNPPLVVKGEPIRSVFSRLNTEIDRAYRHGDHRRLNGLLDYKLTLARFADAFTREVVRGR